jgi:vacuolar protein sorting-associated protein 54
MSQVLAAINHNLQEEYSAIRLPNQEAKDRLLADAKFLHEKLSALKNIPGASTAMLVTVVSEKVPANAPKRIPANQRIKGMLYRSTGNTQGDVTPPPQSAMRECLSLASSNIATELPCSSTTGIASAGVITPASALSDKRNQHR